MLRRFLVFLVAFSSLSAWAECTQFQGPWRGHVGPWSSSKESACSSINGMSMTGSGNWVSTTVSGTHVDQSGNCAYTETSLYTDGQSVDLDTASGILTRTVAACDSPCKELMGQDFTLNWTYGYTRTPNIDADPNWKFVAPRLYPPSDGMVCDPVSSCKAAMVLIPTAVWQSVSPTSQGLYRVSVDYDAQYFGESCTPTEVDTAGASPAADKPTCPGFVGEVNGVPGCYGTASNPTANDVPAPKPKPPEAGNPPAGKTPDSGEGSGTGGAGRTPSTGDGGPAGGPAAAAGSGTKPDGTTPKPGEGKEQANCGAPGQPKCRIDETGTPNGSDVKNKLTDDVNKAADQQKAEIEKAANLKADGWTFSFSLPSGCTALTLAGYQIPGQGPLSIDVCKWQPMIHDVMTMIWLICTVWGCINMVGSTQRSS